MSLNYRLFDFHREDLSQLHNLFILTYGEVDSFKQRWKWQYLDHPQTKNIKMIVAEDGEKLVGTRSLFPQQIMLQGSKIQGVVSSDTMVHPDYRRRGIMDEIVNRSLDVAPVAYAKGVNPGMYTLLMKRGYKPIRPNTFMRSIVSISKMVLARFDLYKRVPVFEKLHFDPTSEFQYAESFGPEFDTFWRRIAPSYFGIWVKNSDYMNWRYVNQPYIDYHAFYHKRNGEIVSVVLLRQKSLSGYIADIIWDPQVPTEPQASIEFAKKYMGDMGFKDIYAWATQETLRKCLRKFSFRRLESRLNFCVHAAPDLVGMLSQGKDFHVVHGDGDNDFL